MGARPADVLEDDSRGDSPFSNSQLPFGVEQNSGYTEASASSPVHMSRSDPTR